MKKEINETKRNHNKGTLEWKILDFLEGSREKGNYHNFRATRNLAVKRYWATLILGIISTFVYLGLILILANQGHKLSLDFFIATLIFPISSISSFMQLDRYRMAVEWDADDIKKDDEWFFKRGKAEFIGRAAIFITTPLMFIYLYAISGDIKILAFSIAYTLSQLFKSVHAITMLWVGKNPKRLLSPKIIAFCESLFYVGNLWWLMGILFVIFLMFIDIDDEMAQAIITYGSFFAILKVFTETLKRAKKIEKEKTLTMSHTDIIYFAYPEKLIFQLKNDFEQFFLKLTDFGKTPTSKKEARKIYNERKADKIEKEEEKQSNYFILFALSFIGVFIYIIDTWCKEIVKIPFKKIFLPILDKEAEELSPYVLMGLMVILVLLVQWGIKLLKKIK